MDMMNMTSDGSMMGNSTMPMMAMAMMPFHSAVGFDMLWFQGWMPMTASSTFGACIGLFFLAGFYRFLVALRITAELIWIAREDPKGQQAAKDAGVCCDKPDPFPHFNWTVNILRGLLEGLVSLVGYLLMLAVMVMNAWFFIAIILGIIVGETFFGGFASRGVATHRVH